MKQGIRTAAVAALAAGAAGIGGGVSAAPAAAAGECPAYHGFPSQHRTWIGKVLRVGLGVAGECGAAYTGGPRVRRDTSCQPHGQIRLAVWGSWFLLSGDYITVRAYVEAKDHKRWVGATKTNLKWSADTRFGKADGMLGSSLLRGIRNNPIDGWLQFYGEHAWSVSGFISGEMVRVHVVIRWKHEDLGPDSTRATFDERIGRYCFAQEDDTGRTPPAVGAPNVPGIP